MHLVVQGGSRRNQHGPAQKGQRVFDLEIINELVDERMSAKCYLPATSRITFRSPPLHMSPTPSRTAVRTTTQESAKTSSIAKSFSHLLKTWASATDSYPACS